MTAIEDANDWDHHWAAYGEAADGNPANAYRRYLILKLMGEPAPGSVVLDIGSGQGEFARHLEKLFSAVEIWGVEYSAAGVARSRAERARFVQADLMRPVALDLPPASVAVCSEVLEHVSDPATLMRNASTLLAPGCRVIITVPGGPRSAFDLHIGHYQHFTARKLRTVLTHAGYRVDRILRAGFPFFNLYKLAVIARGRRLIADVSQNNSVPGVVNRVFDFGLSHSLDDFPLGWQLAAVATWEGHK